MNKDICLKAINDNINLLNNYLNNINRKNISLFDPRKKSKYFISFGIVLCLIYIILYLLNLKIFVPLIMQYLFLIMGIITIILGLIFYLCSKLKILIPYLNLKNVINKLTDNSKNKINKLTKKLIINNQNISSYKEYNDQKINKKMTEYYNLLDIVYIGKYSVFKNVILEDFKK